MAHSPSFHVTVLFSSVRVLQNLFRSNSLTLFVKFKKLVFLSFFENLPLILNRSTEFPKEKCRALSLSQLPLCMKNHVS